MSQYQVIRDDFNMYSFFTGHSKELSIEMINEKYFYKYIFMILHTFHILGN